MATSPRICVPTSARRRFGFCRPVDQAFIAEEAADFGALLLIEDF